MIHHVILFTEDIGFIDKNLGILIFPSVPADACLIAGAAAEELGDTPSPFSSYLGQEGAGPDTFFEVDAVLSDLYLIDVSNLAHRAKD